MAHSALQFNTNALYQAVTQILHNFNVGDVLLFDGVDFVLADNTSEANAMVIGMVSSIINADQFYLTQEGFVSGLTTIPTEGGLYVPGSQYYLSATPGELTAIKPVAPGAVIVPAFIAFSTTSGFFASYLSTYNNIPSLYPWTVVNANTSMAVNNGYFINGGGSINMLLPAVSAVGDTVRIATLGTNGCVITQNAPNSVNIVDVTSTVGLGGTTTLQTTNGVLSGSLELVCMTADTDWKVISGTGIWTPA